MTSLRLMNQKLRSSAAASRAKLSRSKPSFTSSSAAANKGNPLARGKTCPHDSQTQLRGHNSSFLWIFESAPHAGQQRIAPTLAPVAAQEASMLTAILF